MNKKEMIEEMQKVMEYTCNVYDEKGNRIRNKCNTWDCEYYCDTNGVCCSYSKKEATALYNAGYRKIPEGSVVLTKEEYKNDFCSQFDKGYKTARKETAKEILQALTTVIHDNTKYGGNFVVLYLKDLQELAKQFGVEVE